ncbi:MAG TPA: cohesin domain-containing protein [Bryobacteraceae bacterium]|nr:cohesin domain-containing protein [Bryobacteraceae bacterium]
MKRIFWAVSLLVFRDVASAATILIDPASSTTSVGGAANVAIQVTDVNDLYAYQFDLSFDPTVLSITGVSEGGFLSSGGSTFFFPGTIDNALGTLSLTAGALEGPVSGVNGGGILAMVQFTGVGFGTSPVTLSNVVLLDSAGGDIAAATIQNGSVTVVPEPMSGMLLGAGVLAGVIVRAYRGSLQRS